MLLMCWWQLKKGFELTSTECPLPRVPWRGSTWMAATERNPHPRKAQTLQLKLPEVISTRSHVCSASANTVPDLFVVLPNTLAASPKAASDGPVRETRAAAPASRPSAARLLTACVHPNAAQKRQNTSFIQWHAAEFVAVLLRHSPHLAAGP